MARIKICGMRNERDILAVNKIKPDYIGYIFTEHGPRSINDQKAMELNKILDPSIIPVGVFVDAPIQNVISLLQRKIISVAQLHGNETEDYIKEIQERTQRPVINAIGVKSEIDVNNAVNSCADYILLDTPGGSTGRSFDWDLLSGICRPFFLAGGINVNNVQSALERFHPFGIDLCSGAETDGEKDTNKMRVLVCAAHSY